MSRFLLTAECADALEEARWATRSECVGDLLEAALDGDAGALEAIADRWPADTSGERTHLQYVRTEVLDALFELAQDAPEQPRRRGPKGSGLDGITELLRRWGPC